MIHAVNNLNTNKQKNMLFIDHFLFEYQAGYGNKTLGLPKYTPLNNIPRIDASMLKSYTKEFYRPERMVLAGVGIDHQTLVNLGKKYFSVPKSETKTIDEQTIEANKAIWTGGVVMVKRLIN